ncbi:hypothetical protein CI109_104913 [Kwoniella shandongensis]|uniref:Uncharacterized protein n=1 Tax=Kwoniella shandongensis TaxID=1734106 RepID=A0A5M6BST9_9TREE|nr:uncharacterized protein CI109_006631 [Kwoniella shandongensis]KAA5525080.1 hypothetical protein CI109_006631 [Kwoniella shandongensis]
MGKAEAGSTKAIANAIKAKGLGRLRWYCQVCEKQCRDENGFQAHCRSEPHMRKIMLVGPKAGNAISEFSRQFQYDFVLLLRTRHQTNRVRANAVYNEYIQDKHHVHMNSTKWVTLSGFVQTLGKAGIVRVDEDEKGIWVQWIDNRPETLSKQAALQKRDRAEMDGEERERRMLEDQIARAKAQLGDQEDQNVGLQKKEGEKITLNLFGTPSDAEVEKKPDLPADDSANLATEAGPSNTSTAPASAAAKPTFSFGSFSTPSSSAPKPLVNPLKRPAPVNVFKTASAKSAKTDREDSSSLHGHGGKQFVSEAERLMKEDLARKSRNNGGGGGQSQGYRGMGPSRGGR